MFVGEQPSYLVCLKGFSIPTVHVIVLLSMLVGGNWVVHADNVFTK